MNISAWAIRHPVPVALMFGLMVLGGLLAFRTMGIQNFPDLDVPTITVTALLPGASPNRIEAEVARKVEDALATVQGIRHIDSVLADGTAHITVTFRFEKPTQEALDDVRDAVSRIRGQLPADLRDPVIKKTELAGSPILTYTVASEQMDDGALSWFVDNQIRRVLLAVPGVGAINRAGGADREVRIELDPRRLLALGVTAAEISRQLRLVQQEASGGRVELGGTEQPVRVLAKVASVEELGALQLALRDGRRIRLDQVATVSDTVAERRSAALLAGIPVVGFDVVRARGYGEIDVAKGVRAALADLRSEHPGLKIEEAFNAVDPIAENYAGSMRLLGEAAALAVLVIALFLRDARATLVAAVALPLSVLPTFVVMHWMGFTLNTVTLLALSLVAGMVVDDAIVEIENIERHLSMGKSPRQASIDATGEIGPAVAATTFTLIAVFLPTAFMSGMAGKFFFPFGLTAAVAVFFSFVVARLLTPMMAAYLLKPSASGIRREPAWLGRYLRLVRMCLERRAAILAAVLMLVAGGLELAAKLPTALVPSEDDAQTHVALSLEPGATLRDTVAMAERARHIVEQNPQVRTVSATVGDLPSEATAMPSLGVNAATLILGLTPRRERGGLHRQQIEQQLRVALEALPGVQVAVGEAEKYVLVLASNVSSALGRHASLVERELRAIPGIGAVTSRASLVRPELTIRPDYARAADAGVASAAMAEALRVATTGDYEQELAKLDLGERVVPAVVRMSDMARKDIDTLRRLPIPGSRGPVALENIATLDIGGGSAQITRHDRLRNIAIEIEPGERTLGEVEHALAALPSLRQLPAGIERGVMGDAEEMGELAAGFGLAMLSGVLCIYAVLVLLMRDFMQPATILAALVLSVPGAALALYLSGSALSMPSTIGLIMLMGMTAKNSILLVDYIAIARREYGLGRMHAILDACRKRARPIIMTTIAMSAGMLPVALGFGGDPSFRAPMARVVIGGLASSTILSLLVIPLLYSLLDDSKQWVFRRLSGARVRMAGTLR